MKIVIASDSYKGCLSSAQVGQAVSEGIRECVPDCETVCVCIADGGEGTVEAVVANTGGEYVDVNVKGPLGKEVVARYGIALLRHSELDSVGRDIPGGRVPTAIIEMAQASGLPLLRKDELDPMAASTFGTGQMIMDAASRGCRHFLVGLGGSATCDGGTGMLAALGVRFLDAAGNEIVPCGAAMASICGIDVTGVPSCIRESRFTVACDVDTPFCGPVGASYVFAPQKGATEEQVELLDKGLQSFAAVVERELGRCIADLAGAGAAGGLGGAFAAFLDSELRPGIEMVLDAASFDGTLQGADLVITGEGRIDGQTARGKAPYGVLCRARKYGIRTFAFGGAVLPGAEEAGFDAVFRVSPEGMPLEQAIRPEVAAENLRRTAKEALKTII